MGAAENAALEPLEEVMMGDEDAMSALKARRRSSRRKSAASEARADAQEPEEEEDLKRDSVSSRASAAKRRSSSKRKSRTKSKAEAVAAAAAQDEDVTSAAVYLRGVAAVLLTVFLALDILGLGLRGGSSAFIDWWDMIGTVCYVRGRHPYYSLRKRENQTSVGWALYTLLNAFLLYEIAGKTARTIMRKTPVLSTAAGLVKFTVMGFLPVHFFPGDHLFEMVEHNDIQQVIVAAYWGTTKTRSVFNQVDEAVNVHHYNVVQAFLLCVLSCEIASVVSRIDRNVCVYPLDECARRFPGGMKAWLTSRTFVSSLFISAFTFATVRTVAIPGVWTVFIGLTLCAAFYRYANGLFERTVEKYVLAPLRESGVLASVWSDEDEAVDEDDEDEIDEDAPILDKLLHMQKTKAKNFSRALEKTEALFQSAIDALPAFVEQKVNDAPIWAVSQYTRAYNASRLVLGQLQRDTVADAQTFQGRIEEIQDEIEHSAKKLKLL